jgi:hypothetical protein
MSIPTSFSTKSIPTQKAVFAGSPGKPQIIMQAPPYQQQVVN